MLIKTEKKRKTVLQVAALFLVMSLAIFTITCGDDDDGKTGNPDDPDPDKQTPTITNYSEILSWGTEFTPATLGLNPGNDTTEIRLNWYSSGAIAGKAAHVRFIRGTKTEGLELIEKAGAIADASAGSWTNTSHKVEVTGLKPGSSYQYSVSNDGTNWSPMYDFKIPEVSAAFKFAVVADPQLNVNAGDGTSKAVDVDSRYRKGDTTASNWLETMGKIMAKGVSFIAFGGDQVDITNTGNEVEYENFFAPPELRNLPFSPVSGNHDAHNPFMFHYNLPNAQTLTGAQTDIQKMGNYFYLYNRILFVVLNTAPYPGSTEQARPFIDFFRQTLTNAKAAHSADKYDWLIVQHHKSTASVGDHVADRDIGYYVEAGFETLMSEFNVDFVLAGHDHVYARSYPLKGRDAGRVSVPNKTFNSASGSTWNSPGDPIYLTFTTGSGIKYYAVSADKTYAYKNTIYVKDHTTYPYLGEVTDAEGTSSSLVGSASYVAGNLPVSNAAYVQPYIPSYCIVEVNGRTIKFSTYPIGSSTGTDAGAEQAHDFNLDVPYDVITITK